MTVQDSKSVYPARLEVDYPDQHDRVTTFFRVFMVIPIGIVVSLLSSGVTQTSYDKSGQMTRNTSGGIAVGLFSVGAFFAVVIAWFAILITGRYPRGLFDFVVGVARWWLRVQAYASLLVTDRYPPFSLS
jgi:hypothetical protein